MDNLQIYLKSIRPYDKLNDEKTELLIAMGVEKNRKKIINGNLHLAVKVAMDMNKFWSDYDIMDFIQEANLTLLRVVDEYDINKKIRFSSFYSLCARNDITRYIKNNTGPLTLYKTRSQQKIFNCLSKIKNDINNKNMPLKNVASKYKINLDDLEMILNSENTIDPKKIIIDSPESDFIDNERDMNLVNKIQGFKYTLDDRERYIFNNVILDNNISGKEVAKIFHISQPRVTTIKQDILSKAKKYFSKEDLLDLIGN